MMMLMKYHYNDSNDLDIDNNNIRAMPIVCQGTVPWHTIGIARMLLLSIDFMKTRCSSTDQVPRKVCCCANNFFIFSF